MVGTEFLRLLDERNFPIDQLRVYASPRSEGRKLPFKSGDVTCEVLRDGCFEGLDLVIVDVDDPISAEWSPRAVADGAKVIDKSGAFRMDPDVPLVLAEINPEDMQQMRRGIASSPNCTTTVPLMALAPLHHAARIDRMVVSTYQAVSGAGQPGLHELDAQWTKLDGRSADLARAATFGQPLVEGEVWSKPIAGNVIPLAGSVKEAGYTSEEWKMVHESRKILHDDEIKCTVTCVRVPVYVGHSVSANVRFHRPMSKAEAVSLLREAPGVRLVDDGDGIPTPQDAAGIEPILVGRIREDPTEPGTLDLWVTGDNVLKGAALNGIQMAELLL
jgi:aspartate-semialdehyde dehydrogenase